MDVYIVVLNACLTGFAASGGFVLGMYFAERRARRELLAAAAEADDGECIRHRFN